MTSLRIGLAAVALSVALSAAWPGGWSRASTPMPTAGTPAPDISAAGPWFNSKPLSLPALRGKVVLVEFWTRECINCLHVLPHTKALHERYAKDGLVIVGIHTPEFDEERSPKALQKAIDQFGIGWPVAMDNDYRVWNAYGNQFWPALYLIDQNGRVVYRHFGEGNYDETEQRVRELLGKA